MLTPGYTGTNGHRNGSGAAKPTRRIKHILKETTAARRAIDALRLVEAGYTSRQAARAAGASFGYLNTARKLSPVQTCLSSMRSSRSPPSTIQRRSPTG
jgi:hypothetical protein